MSIAQPLYLLEDYDPEEYYEDANPPAQSICKGIFRLSKRIES